MIKKCLLLGALTLMLLQNFAAASPYSYIDYANREDPKQQQQMLDPRYHEMIIKSAYLSIYQFGLVYGLTRLPESWTKWRPEQRRFRNFGRNWRRHVQTEPRFDNDHDLVNFVGHPWAGSNYYVMARETGLTSKESYIYAILESTFMWEYGFEAMVEVPSIQDLIITPTFGAIWGELKYRGIQRIQANNGYFMGSPTAGKVALVLLSPYNAIVGWTRNLFRGADKQPDIAANFSYVPVASSDNHKMLGKASPKRFMFNMQVSF